MNDITLDKDLLLATIADYVEQLAEEGLEGAPLGVGTENVTDLPAEETDSLGPSSPTRSGRPKKAESDSSAATSRAGIVDSSAQPLSTYPGLDSTANLEALREFIGDCKRCKLAGGRTNLVFGGGDPKADLMFIGEAPGADEDLSGEPFVGRAGQLLTDIIERGMGLRRSDVYITNVVKCRPPGNRNPEPDEVAACEPFMRRQIELVRPRVIVGLGAFAVHTLLGVKTPISKLRGIWHQVRGVKVMATFHPAYLLRNPADKRLVWADIREVMKDLDLPLPKRS